MIFKNPLAQRAYGYLPRVTSVSLSKKLTQPFLGLAIFFLYVHVLYDTITISSTLFPIVTSLFLFKLKASAVHFDYTSSRGK